MNYEHETINHSEHFLTTEGYLLNKFSEISSLEWVEAEAARLVHFLQDVHVLSVGRRSQPRSSFHDLAPLCSIIPRLNRSSSLDKRLSN